MRILIAGQTYFPAMNGQSTFTVSLAEGLAARGHEVEVLVPSRGRNYARTRRNGVEIHEIGSVWLRPLHPDAFYTLPFGRLLRTVYERFRPEIVHIQDHYPISRGVATAAMRRGLRLIGTNHFVPENLLPYVPFAKGVNEAAQWALWHWMLELYNRLDLATVPSKTAAEIVRRHGLRVPVHPISCGVNLRRFGPQATFDRSAILQRYGLRPERTTFLFVGRVDKEKRVDVLLEALAVLHRPDLQLAVTGRGAALARMQRLTAELGLEPQVRFTGYVPDEDLPALLQSADVFTMPSEAELLSIATLEAMASARPILAARAKALPELVSEGINGYLFRAGDPLDAARYMAFLADHRERLAEMGAASLERAQLHSLENSLRSYEKLYERLVSEAAPSAVPASPRLRAPHGKRVHSPDTGPWRG